MLKHGRFRVAAESRAFLGWRAEEIHLALNEPTPSAQTSAAWSGLQRRSVRAKAPARTTTRCSARNGGRGFEHGHAEVVRAARKVVRKAMRRAARKVGRRAARKPGRRWSVRFCDHGGIEVSARFSTDTEAFAAASEEALLAAALGCADEAEFLAALRRSRDPGG